MTLIPAHLEHSVAFSCAGVLLLVAGIVLLRQRWLARRQHGLPYLLAGWLAVSIAFPVLGNAWGAELGTFYALGLLSVVAYAIVGTTMERRPAKRREREPSIDPEERPTNWRRGIGKALLAIVLAGVASIGLGVASAIHLPLPPQDRAVIGGLLVPILWGAGMAWTLCDPRLVRATVILLGVSAFGYGIAILPKALT
jgi:hypothetical protein